VWHRSNGSDSDIHMDGFIAPLEAILRPLGRRLRVRDAFNLAQAWFWLAMLGALGLQVIGRVWPVENLWFWSAAPLMLWAVLVAGFAFLRPLPEMRVARRLDAELALKERLSTALALPAQVDGHADPELLQKQHHDALTIAHSIEPGRVFTLTWQRKPLAVAGLLAVAVIALAVLPNPMHQILADRAAVAQVLEEQAQQIEELATEIEKDETLSPEARDELLRQLEELARQLRANPGDREQALADLSRLAESLRRASNPALDLQRQSLESLAAQLQALAESQRESAN
jgi:hypothetical protein